MRVMLFGTLLIGPALLAASPADAAQPPQATVQPPQTAVQPPQVPAYDPNAINGSIQLCPAARGEHRVQLQAGQRYHISATSPAFDPYLRLLTPGSEAPLAEDDDSGGGLVPLISYTPTASGEYVVRVSSFDAGSAGNYQLSVKPAGPMPALISRPSRVERGQSSIFQGSLAATDSAELGRRYDDYELRLSAGESAMIHVQGQAGLDTQLQIFPLGDRGGKPIRQDDDGGGGADPFIFFTPDQAGTFVVRVIGLDEQSAGAYQLRISR